MEKKKTGEKISMVRENKKTGRIYSDIPLIPYHYNREIYPRIYPVDSIIINAFTHTDTQTHGHTDTHARSRGNTQGHSVTHTHTDTHARSHGHTCTLTRTRTCTLTWKYTHVHAHTRTFTHPDVHSVHTGCITAHSDRTNCSIFRILSGCQA